MEKKKYNIRLDPRIHAAAKLYVDSAGLKLEFFISEAMKAALPVAYKKGLSK